MIFVVQARLVTVEQGERRVGAREGVEGQPQTAALSDVFPYLLDIFALLFHFDIEEGSLDAGIAAQAPVGGRELADEVVFRLVGGGEMAEVIVKLGLVLFGGLVGENYGFRGKAMFYGIEQNGQTPSFGFWTARFGSIDTGSFGSGRHVVYLAKV